MIASICGDLAGLGSLGISVPLIFGRILNSPISTFRVAQPVGSSMSRRRSAAKLALSAICRFGEDEFSGRNQQTLEDSISTGKRRRFHETTKTAHQMARLGAAGVQDAERLDGGRGADPGMQELKQAGPDRSAVVRKPGRAARRMPAQARQEEVWRDPREEWAVTGS